ncbi:hypothetical protein ACQ1ZB_15115, partial [Enterococcus faecalis]
RGLVFSDKENAKKKLFFYGYYEIITGYKDFLLEKKQKITDHQEECFIENSSSDGQLFFTFFPKGSLYSH